MSNMLVFIQSQVVITVSAPSFKNTNRGSRLVIKASLIAVLTCFSAQFGLWGFAERVESKGWASSRKVVIRVEAIIRGVGCIAFTWSCAKSLWFLRPTDELLSFKSLYRVSFGV